MERRRALPCWSARRREHAQAPVAEVTGPPVTANVLPAALFHCLPWSVVGQVRREAQRGRA